MFLLEKEVFLLERERGVRISDRFWHRLWKHLLAISCDFTNDISNYAWWSDKFFQDIWFCCQWKSIVEHLFQQLQSKNNTSSSKQIRSKNYWAHNQMLTQKISKLYHTSYTTTQFSFIIVSEQSEKYSVIRSTILWRNSITNKGGTKWNPQKIPVNKVSRSANFISPTQAPQL